MKKLKFSSKQDLAAPIEIDTVRLIKVEIDFQKGTFTPVVALIDSDAADGKERVREERSVCIGLASVEALGPLKLDKLTDDVLETIQNSGALPAGSVVEDDDQ